jgi:pyruvate dehydrogenase E2 component (dihydrolipoamide acetyltransferase)
MSREFRFQDPGEGIHEGEVVEVMVGEGDAVEDGDIVLSVETDKATTEVPSPYGGTVEHIAVQAGDRIEVGDLLMRFADQGSEAGESGKPAEAAEAERDEGGGAEATESGEAAASGGESAEQVSPRGEAGGEKRQRRGGRDTSRTPVPAAPSTRRLARELDVDLRALDGSGPGGRVLAEDVRAAAEGAPAGEGGRRASDEGRRETARAGGSAALPDFGRWGEIERVPLRSVRRATAQAMARAWAEIPHVMHHDLVDITELERFRREQAAEIEQHGGKLTLTVLVMKAAVAALRKFPRFNASLDTENDEIVLKHYFHLGMAVATEQGLLVPVLRDVDRKSVADLAVELTELAERVRQGDAGREELQGGTFTLTNVGAIGGALFTPIIRYPEVAILGLGRAAWQPVVEGDAEQGRVVARLRLPLCLAFDHRVVDGAEAARFVNHLAASLQDPEALLLAV